MDKSDNSESHPGKGVRLKNGSSTNDDEDSAKAAEDGYNSNARFYLKQAKKVHLKAKATDDAEMVSLFYRSSFITTSLTTTRCRCDRGGKNKYQTNY